MATPSGRDRLAVIAAHLSHRPTSTATPIQSASTISTKAHSDENAGLVDLVDFTRPPTKRQMALMQFLAKYAEDRTKHQIDFTELLPGPWDDDHLKTIPDVRDRYHRIIAGNARWPGKNMLYNLELCRKYGGQFSCNMCSPEMLVERGNKVFITWMVKILDNEDARRLAAKHVKKSVLYDNTFLRDGVLSVRDNDLWKAQREHLTAAFLPYASLSKIFPISLQRGTFAMEHKLPQISENMTQPVEMWEFWLHEAMAQLQLGLLGETQEFQELTNKRLRTAFSHALGQDMDMRTRMINQKKGKEFVLNYSATLVDRAVDPVTRQPLHSAPSRNVDDAVHGPLTAQISTLKKAVEDQGISTALPVDRDTAATFLFAGHDTTANLMTWMTFEMARRPELQSRLQREVDDVYDSLQGRALTYDDLPKMTFLTRCITETLRLWPSVPNGTFRELETDEVIKGRNGKPVTIPKGTNVQINVWSLHVNPELWGDDVEVFNPDREFLPEELAGGESGANPQSHRYCPFTFNPRSCIGRNFAMMEARVLLSLFFRKYSVALAEPTLSQAPTARDPVHFIGRNVGTMGPGDGMFVTLTKR